ncbi:MAG: hypothetical protein HUU06_04070 [Planctomycetaceae bacterium]|nr:hypothetical protein [Planctomycetaceae bacterium]
MSLRTRSPKGVAAVWLGAAGVRTLVEDESRRKELERTHRLVWHWTQEPGETDVLVLVNEEPDDLVAKRARRKAKRLPLAWDGGALVLGLLPLGRNGRFPPSPEPQIVASLPPGKYEVSVLDTGWRTADEERLTKAVVKRCGGRAWWMYNAAETAGCLAVLIGLITVAGMLIAAFKEGMWRDLALPIGVAFVATVIASRLSRVLKRLPCLRRVDDATVAVRALPEWSFPDVALVVRSARTDSDPAGGVAARLRAVMSNAKALESESSLEKWLARRWAHFESRGPAAFVPERVSFVESPWEDEDLSLYGALYPRSLADSVVDFQVFASYSSSAQQDVIRYGAVRADSFVPTEPAEGVAQVLRYLRASEIHAGHDAVLSSLEDLDLPESLGWLRGLEYEAALSDAGPDGIEWVAASRQGFVMLFAVDG